MSSLRFPYIHSRPSAPSLVSALRPIYLPQYSNSPYLLCFFSSRIERRNNFLLLLSSFIPNFSFLAKMISDSLYSFSLSLFLSRDKHSMELHNSCPEARMRSPQITKSDEDEIEGLDENAINLPLTTSLGSSPVGQRLPSGRRGGKLWHAVGLISQRRRKDSTLVWACLRCQR